MTTCMDASEGGRREVKKYKLVSNRVLFPLGREPAGSRQPMLDFWITPHCRCHFRSRKNKTSTMAADEENQKKDNDVTIPGKACGLCCAYFIPPLGECSTVYSLCQL